MSEKPTYFNQAMLDALREAFDGDNVPMKNIMLRRAYDTLAMQEPASEPKYSIDVYEGPTGATGDIGVARPASEPARASLDDGVRIVGLTDSGKLKLKWHRPASERCDHPMDVRCVRCDPVGVAQSGKGHAPKHTIVEPASEPAPASAPQNWVVRKNGYFYRPNSRGYTASILEAGRYTREEAETHAACASGEVTAHPASDFPVPASAPSEWVMVPRQPTEAMITAGHQVMAQALIDSQDRRERQRIGYLAMVEAAPASAPSCCGAWEKAAKIADERGYELRAYAHRAVDKASFGQEAVAAAECWWVGHQIRAMAAGCCSAISPCAHQRQDPTTICDTCKTGDRHE